MAINKVVNTIEEALEPLKSGDSVLVGGFGLVGAPLTLIDGLIKKEVNKLTIISNNLGEQGKGLGKVLNQGKIVRGIGSYFTSNRDVGDAYQKGEIDLTLVPQGTMIEAIRAGGAGIPAFYTKTAAGTDLGKGKETREFNGELYVMERAITADVALIRAKKADKLGNLIYNKTARNFNPEMATAGKYVVAEVDEIVETGELDPEEIITPHIYVDAVVQATNILK